MPVTEKKELMLIQKKKIKRLKTCVTFLPGSWDKRFVRQLPMDVLTAKQLEWVNKLFDKYRRQIDDYDEIIARENGQPVISEMSVTLSLFGTNIIKVKR